MKTYKDQLFEDIQVRRQKAKDLKINPRKRAYQIAIKLPQAVFKITSWAHDAESVMSTLSYVSREGDLELEDPQGALLNAEEVKERLVEWETDFDTHKKRSRESAHIIFSTPEGSDPEAAKAAFRRFASDVFANHDYLFVGHDDTDFFHIHAVVKARGFEMTKLDPGRKDLKDWRNYWAECLRDEGIQVEASSRLMRGFLTPAPRFGGTKPYLRDPERDLKPIPKAMLSSAQKRFLKRSEGYQRAFEAIGADLSKQGAEKKDARLIGMGKAVEKYAEERDRQQLRDVQRLYYLKRTYDKAAQEKDGPGKEAD